MFSSTLMLLVCASTGVYIVQGDSPMYNPDEELCAFKDPCGDLDGFCCEGLRGNCCVDGQCTNSTVCKIGGERCGQVRCSITETCVRSQPCVCCPNCFVPILPTCKPKCGDRACYRNEFCVSYSNGRKSCADLDGFCCEGLRGGCCVDGQCTNSTMCKIGGERCGHVKCSVSETCVRSQPCVCCPNCFVPILPTCKHKCGDRACYRNEVCMHYSNSVKKVSKCVKFSRPLDPISPSVIDSIPSA